MRRASRAGTVLSTLIRRDDDMTYERVGRSPRRYSDQQEAQMPKVVLTHGVVDIDRWLRGKAERAAAIESGSGSNVKDYVARDGSNNIAITADVEDLEAMQSMLDSPPPDVMARMEEHGVVPPITVYVAAD